MPKEKKIFYQKKFSKEELKEKLLIKFNKSSMGGKNTKTKKNKTFQEIGQKANKDNPNTFQYSNTINLTNEVIVSQSNKQPSDDYKRVKFLGEGSYASVYCVENKITGAKHAMKIIDKSSNCSDETDKEILNEITILRTLDHPNILKIFEFYSTKESYSIVTELCRGGELFQEIIDRGPFNEIYSAYVMLQIFSAINYCHSMKIVHRDLKPENILIVERDKNGMPRIKIADFGTSRMFEKGAVQRKLVGSSYYIAPEVLKKHYDEKCDIWSCGVIMYILLSGRPPFAGDNDREIMDKVAKGKYDLEESPFDKLSNSGKDLIRKLLVMDPKKRISAQEALNHPWFKEKKSRELYNRIKDEATLTKMINKLRKQLDEAKSTIVQKDLELKQKNKIIEDCSRDNDIDIVHKENLEKGKESSLVSKCKNKYFEMKKKYKKKCEENEILKAHIKITKVKSLENENINLQNEMEKLKNLYLDSQEEIESGNKEIEDLNEFKDKFIEQHNLIKLINNNCEQLNKENKELKSKLNRIDSKYAKNLKEKKKLKTINMKLKFNNEKLLVEKKQREDAMMNQKNLELKKVKLEEKLNEYKSEYNKKRFEVRYVL